MNNIKLSDFYVDDDLSSKDKFDINSALIPVFGSDEAVDEIFGGIDEPTTIKYRFDRNKPASKDEYLNKLIPHEISHCSLNALGKSYCMSNETVKDINKIINGSNKPIENYEEVVNTAKQKLNCGDDEKCVLVKLEKKLGEQRVRGELIKNFKIDGPRDTKLLSNVNIDNILQQWKYKFKDFFPYNFNMLDYEKYSFRNGQILNQPDTLATISFKDLYAKGYRTVACVINSDKYSGPGKHWMALFVDARAPIEQANKWSVEFFNSSGNAPVAEWVNWLIKTQDEMKDIANNDFPQCVKVTNIKHQRSKTECGIYSLFYIWSRLNGIPYKYFQTIHVPDQIMFEFRFHLFEDKKFPVVKKFDWNEYTKQIDVKWE